MANLKKTKTFTTPSIITYEVSLYKDYPSRMTCERTRSYEEARKMTEVLRAAGFDIVNVSRHIEEIEPDIFMSEICELTGLKRSTIYQMKDKMPIRTKGNKITAKRSEILAWQNSR